ncbi:MAG TPA: amidohydrolase, partial [Bacteroidales bacterium]|nr:amidohydrolase [Bacteroidales bacterium]
MENSSNIASLAAQIYPKLVAVRRQLHKYPELSGSEKNTATLICSVLDDWNIPYRSGIGGHGVVALIEGKTPG